jgi:RNAse (barnase) inhibitor barstar
MPLVQIDTRQIRDWDTFHDVFAEAFGFPEFYGRNMNAWIDCMGYLDDESAGMTEVHVQPGDVLTLALDHIDDLAARCPEMYEAIVECAAFVNWRRIESGLPGLLALAFHK